MINVIYALQLSLVKVVNFWPDMNETLNSNLINDNYESSYS